MLKILHLFLACNLLCSTAGITVFEHTCQQKGRSISFWGQPKRCCAAKPPVAASSSCCQKRAKACCEKPAPTKAASSAPAKPCCQDKAHWLKADTEGTLVKVTSFSIGEVMWAEAPLAPFALAWPALSLGLDAKTRRLAHYESPPPLGDLPVRLRVFRC